MWVVSDADKFAAWRDLAERLRRLPDFTRKLLAHIVDLSYREHHDGRDFGVAYLPEVHETSGIGVDELYAILQQLQTADFIRVQGQYPFQCVVPAELILPDGSKWPVMSDLAFYCKSKGVSLRAIIVDLYFEKLVEKNDRN